MNFDLGAILLNLGIFAIAGSIHEFAHAVSAYTLGDSTARDEGRMTLNPVVHVDPIGTILFPIILTASGVPAFGWMRPVPVNPFNLYHPRRDDAVVSFAGPFSNFVQACLALLVLRLLPNPGPLVMRILLTYTLMNIILMGFNLIPIHPLDGSHILRSFLPPSWADGYDRFAQVGFFLLLVLLWSGALGSILRPLIGVFRWINGLEMVFLILLNVFNAGLILFFFRRSLPFAWNKARWKTKRALGAQQHKQAQQLQRTENEALIREGQALLDKLDQGRPLSAADRKRMEELGKDLDPKANLCPPGDFATADRTCRECEWLRNCLVRAMEQKQA